MEVGDYVVTINNYNKFMEQYCGRFYEHQCNPYGITDDDMLIARVVEVWRDFFDDIMIKVLNHKSYSALCGETYGVNSKYFVVIDDNLVNSYIDYMSDNHGFCEELCADF